MTEHLRTALFEKPWDVNRRLAELGLSHDGLVKAARVACLERSNATEFHPANAAGTFAYHHGVYALRSNFVGTEWVVDRSDGIESIRNDRLKIKVSFCNVDEATGYSHPRPRSDKGAGAERASGQMVFEGLDTFSKRPDGEWRLFYLMVDQTGAAELTCPVIANGTFSGALERIFLVSEVGPDASKTDDLTSDIADGFDPQITRR